MARRDKHGRFIKDTDKGYEAIRGLFDDLEQEPSGVFVGIRGEQGVGKVKDADINMATLGAIHEFGAPFNSGVKVIPERSYLRSTVDENRREYEGLLGAAIGKAIDDAKGQPLFLLADLNRRLGRVGLKVVADVQRKLSDPAQPAPELKAATIARKDSDNPLIDTGRLRASIDHVVRALETA